jgi:hypothetical protein
MGAAVLTESAFEIGFALARDTEFHAGFVAFSCLLVVAAGVVCAAAGALLPGGSARAALALFTALHGFAEPMPLSIELLAAAMALACWWLLAPQRVRGISAGAQGVIVATALCVALVLLSFGEAALSIPDLVAWQGWLTTWAVFASCIAVATVWERTRPPRLPSAAVMCAVALMISLCGTAYAYGLMRSP